ncbi:hypothetical protein [Chloroherpeton thalassium]|nr:hypothetical protein [Chloroherpeton thalassium]
MVKKLLKQSISEAASNRAPFEGQAPRSNKRSPIDQIQDAEYVEIDSKLKENS